MNILTICTNDETLVGDMVPSEHADRAACAYVQAAADTITNARQYPATVDYDTDAFFANWHGGKHDQFGERCGNVSIAKDAPAYVRALAWRAHDAGEQALEAEVAIIEAEEMRAADQFEAQGERETAAAICREWSNG